MHVESKKVKHVGAESTLVTTSSKRGRENGGMLGRVQSSSYVGYLHKSGTQWSSMMTVLNIGLNTKSLLRNRSQFFSPYTQMVST